MNPRQHNRQGGFTLVELLVVIGIIVILIAILLPVVSKVRTEAYSANTLNTIQQLSSACERYYQDFGAYPGPISNDDLEGLNGVALPSGLQITSSENLVLGLMGGLYYNTSTSAVNFSAQYVGGGPLNLNPQNPGGTAAYMANKYLSTGLYQYQGLIGCSDTIVPEFLDAFPDAMPILYMRARKGAHGIVSNAWGLSGNQKNYQGGSAITDYVTGVTAHYQYDVSEICPYTTSAIGVPQPAGATPAYHGLEGLDSAFIYESSPQALSTAANPTPNAAYYATPWYDNAIDYLYNSGVNPGTGPASPSAYDDYYGAPQKPDGFILISAGPDRCYGTADDLTNFGNVR
jgi:prepilin-type N-terminal cleavage/methylation domain-containing protein